jgi:ketosteroid isomerase-like protein
MSPGCRLATIALLATVACAANPRPEAADRRALRPGVDSAANRLLAALRTDGVDSLLALVEDSVVFTPPNEPSVKGKAAIRAWYEGLSWLRTSALVLTRREMLIGGEWVTLRARFEWTRVPVAGGPLLIDRGYYVQLWHREPDGRWLAHSLYNVASPAGRPPAHHGIGRRS